MQKHKVVPPGFESGKFFKCDSEGCVFFSQTKRGLQLHVQKAHPLDQNECKSITGNLENNYCERYDEIVSVT